MSSIASALALSPATTLHAHSDAGLRLRDARLCQPWAAGPSAGAGGPHLLSVNEYRPHRLRDLLPISRLTVDLVRAFAALDDAVGIATAYQPLGRVTYSLSIWKSEETLRAFAVAPLHRRVMAEYRDRGYLRHIHWWGEFTTIGAGMAEATRRLDEGEGRRVGAPRGRWAREDDERLARMESARGQRARA